MFRAILFASSGVQDCDLQHGNYTICCKLQSCAPEDGQRIARNLLS